MTAREAFADGVRRCVPVSLGAIPFGVAAGFAAVSAEMSPLEAVAMSVIIFAGAAQLAVLDLIESGAPVAIVVVIAVLINFALPCTARRLRGGCGRDRSLAARGWPTS